jgi:hypothetical protein
MEGKPEVLLVITLSTHRPEKKTRSEGWKKKIQTRNQGCI